MKSFKILETIDTLIGNVMLHIMSYYIIIVHFVEDRNPIRNNPKVNFSHGLSSESLNPTKKRNGEYVLTQKERNTIKDASAIANDLRQKKVMPISGKDPFGNLAIKKDQSAIVIFTGDAHLNPTNYDVLGENAKVIFQRPPYVPIIKILDEISKRWPWGIYKRYFKKPYKSYLLNLYYELHDIHDNVKSEFYPRQLKKILPNLVNHNELEFIWNSNIGDIIQAGTFVDYSRAFMHMNNITESYNSLIRPKHIISSYALGNHDEVIRDPVSIYMVNALLGYQIFTQKIETQADDSFLIVQLNSNVMTKSYMTIFNIYNKRGLIDEKILKIIKAEQKKNIEALKYAQSFNGKVFYIIHDGNVLKYNSKYRKYISTNTEAIFEGHVHDGKESSIEVNGKRIKTYRIASGMIFYTIPAKGYVLVLNSDGSWKVVPIAMTKSYMLEIFDDYMKKTYGLSPQT